MASGTIHNLQVPVATEIANLYAIKTGVLATLSTDSSGVSSVTTSGAQLPSLLYPKYDTRAFCRYYTSNWNMGWIRIKTDGKIVVYNNADPISVSNVVFNVTYELANG